MAYTISEGLQNKVNEVLAEKERLNTRQQNMRAHNQGVEQELEQARQDLQTAVLAMADDPSAENRQAENDARAKVAKLEMELRGNSNRTSAVFQTGSSQITRLQEETLKMAKTELLKNYNDNEPVILQKVADAKKAYLEALKELYDLTMVDTQGKYFDIAREIGANDRLAGNYKPGVSMHEPILTYRAPGYNYHGISEKEMMQAFKYGVIEKGSISE